MKIEEAISKIQPVNTQAVEEANQHWDSIAKPLNSLGEMEAVVSRLAGILGTPKVDISKRCVVVMCADNGVVAQGVTQTDSMVTTIMTENFVKGTTSVCTMAQYINMDVFAVDLGVNTQLNTPGLLARKIRFGTDDITKGPAMAREEAIKGIEIGIEIAMDLQQQGYQLIATGEMGIGNTTTSSAIAAVLLKQPIEKVTGKGAGLDNEGLKRKIGAVQTAIALNQPNPEDPLDVLAKVGGLDIAGMIGLYLGGAAAGIPVMIDGFISGVSALLACKLCPAVKDYMIPSHLSAEPAGQMVLDALGFKPMLTAGLCLGEGTGAVAALSLIDMGLHVYHHCITFGEIQLEEYIHFDEGTDPC